MCTIIKVTSVSQCTALRSSNTHLHCRVTSCSITALAGFRECLSVSGPKVSSSEYYNVASVFPGVRLRICHNCSPVFQQRHVMALALYFHSYLLQRADCMALSQTSILS